MEKLQALMARKVAGVPVLWIALAIGAVALYGAIRMRPTPSDDDVPEGDGDEPEGDLLDTGQPVFSATPVIMQPSGPSVASTPMEDTNELWGRRAVEWLIKNGFSLTTASNAVTKYLDGQPLSMEEGKARDKAVGQFGLPPEGLIPTGNKVGNPPASAQGTPPTTHTVRGTRDNNTAELARIYYGLTNADAVNLIDAANPTVPKPYARGARVRIPAYRQPKYYIATSAVHTLYAIARKNGTTPARISELNPGKTFPVKPGTRVRVK